MAVLITGGPQVDGSLRVLDPEASGLQCRPQHDAAPEIPSPLQLDMVIKGWTEGVTMMVEGERTRFWVPENLAYKGEAGSPKGMLVFDIDLVEIKR